MTPKGDRTKSEALLDVRYSQRLHFLHARLYRRIQGAVALVALLAGSAAFFTALQVVAHGVAAAGIVVAVASVGDLVFRWSDKAAHHRELRRRYGRILVNEAKRSLDDINAQDAEIDIDDDNNIEALCIVAYNDNLRSNGFEEYMRPERWSSRLIRRIA